MSSKLCFDKIFYLIIFFLFLNVLSSYTANVRSNAKWPLMKTTNTFKMTSIECHNLDKTFATFALCTLKPINRTIKEVSVRVILLKEPVTKLTLRFKVWKRANGYKPFGIDVYFDMCKFLAGKGNIAFDWFYRVIQPYTNINHSCPYYSDMIVEKAPIVYSIPSVFPEGLYRFDVTVSAYNIPRALTSVFVTIDEKDNI